MVGKGRRPRVADRPNDGVDMGTQVRSEGSVRPQHGERKRCSNPKGKEEGCRGFARRHSDPPACTSCGGGTRTSRTHRMDPETGSVTTRATGRVNIPPRVQQLLDGEIDVADLDEEELARGYPRAADGSFRCPPNVIPRTMYNRLQRELFDRANRELRTGLLTTAKYMMEVVNNTALDPKIRLDAAKWVFERIQGKVPDIAVTGDTKKYEEVFEGIDREMPEYGAPGDDGREA